MNKRRQGKLARVIPWLRRFGIASIVTVVLFWVGSWLYLGGYVERGLDRVEVAKNEVLAGLGFRLDNIMLEGRANADASVIMALINMEKGDPLFSFDPSTAQEQIEKMVWVNSARVERRWPDTIYIDLEERKPIAFLQESQKLRLIDEVGEVIHANDLARFEDLVILMGAGAQHQSPALIANLKAEPDIFSRIDSVKYVGERRWDLILRNEIIIKMPENDMVLALRRLADAQENDQILDKDIEHIDLRDQARMIIRTSPGMVQEYKASLQSGEDI